MWQRFTLYDIRVIGHYLGVLVLFSSLALLVPFVTALVCAEWVPASHYLLTIGVSLVVGSVLRFLRIEPGRLNRQQALVVTGLAWIVLALVAAVPLHLSGHYGTYLDALFDAVSGITTTGVSLITDLDHLSNADNMWRFMMHLLGGLGLIVVALSFGLFGKRAGASLYMSEGRSEHVVPNVVQTAQFIGKIAIGVILVATGILAVLCLFAGMETLDRVFARAVAGHIRVLHRRVRPHEPKCHVLPFVFHRAGAHAAHAAGLHQLRLALRGVERAFGGVLQGPGDTHHVFVAGRHDVRVRRLPERKWRVFRPARHAAARAVHRDLGVFDHGFQNITTNQLTTALSSGAFLVVAVLMAVGGSGGSTSGGVKFSRMGVIMKSIVATIKEALAPDSARVVVDYYHVGRRILSPEVVKEAMTVFVLYVATYAVGALVGIAHGYEATQAIFESVTMASNSGVTSGISVSGMPATLEAFYIFQMWAGRLEFVTLLALLVEVVVSLDPRRLVHRS